MYFIFNCKKEIIGNPKGYRTHTGAERACNLPGNVRRKIYDDFFRYNLENPKNTHCYSIRYQNI